MAKDVLEPWIGPHGFECRLTLEPVKQLSRSRSIASFQIRECPVLISDTRKNHRQLIRIRLPLLRFRTEGIQPDLPISFGTVRRIRSTERRYLPGSIFRALEGRRHGDTGGVAD